MITSLSFYKFKKINNLNKLKKLFFKNINSLSLKGLIILSPEGINGTLAGSLKNIYSIKKKIISEFYQRCFGEELPESMINIQS